MPIIKSFSVGNGDMCYIQHGSDNFTLIDCNLTGERDQAIISEIRHVSKSKGLYRFISTHPDEDHFGGIEKLDAAWPISNFYVVQNDAKKAVVTPSFNHYCSLRDGPNSFSITKGCSRKWMNEGDQERQSSGIDILWPDRGNPFFQAALNDCNRGLSPNNISAVIRYKFQGGASVMWLGDLETQFMENISDQVTLEKTTIVFASHHGRHSGKIPNSWLRRLDPQIIIIGEAPSRHLHYYTNYKTLTQNSAGDITMEIVENKIHFFTSNSSYTVDHLGWEPSYTFPNYKGTLTVETLYTL